jgi:hypothetical protein
MDHSEFERFSKAWSSAFELCSRGKVPSGGAINLAFHALREYPLQTVFQALAAHIKSEQGKYGMTVSDIVTLIEGEKPTPDQIIGMALKPTTPLGVLCRIEIGSWNLENWDSFKLRPLAEACLAKLPELKDRVKAGEFAANELDAMKRLEMDTETIRALT